MQRGGAFNPRVYHSADSNKSEIVVVFDTEDTKMAKDFASSADLSDDKVWGSEHPQLTISLNRSIK
jgi:hypothetical protein